MLSSWSKHIHLNVVIKNVAVKHYGRMWGCGCHQDMYYIIHILIKYFFSIIIYILIEQDAFICDVLIHSIRLKWILTKTRYNYIIANKRQWLSMFTINRPVSFILWINSLTITSIWFKHFYWHSSFFQYNLY